MSRKKPDPFDHTVIIPGVPELPAEATLILPLNQPRPEEIQASLPVARWIPPYAPAVLAALALFAGAGWFLGAGSSSLSRSRVHPAPEALADPLPPGLRPYGLAAEHGDPKAMRMLGASYTYGLGVPVNRAQGAAWYRKAAAAGDKIAEQELGAASAGKP